MKTSPSKIFITSIILFSTLLSACSTPPNNANPNADPDGMVFTEEPTSDPEEMEFTEEPTEEGEEMEFTEEPEPDGEPLTAGQDACLIGTWAVNHDSFVGYLVKRMNTSDETTFNIAIKEGSLIWEFTDAGIMSMRGAPNNMIVSVEIIANGQALGSTDVTIEPSGRAEFITYEDLILVSKNIDYEVTGSGSFTLAANGMTGQEGVVSITPGQISTSVHELDVELNDLLPAMDQDAEGVVWYSCNA
ncbi:MAG: hypothetical protein N2D54_09460, partial [Chloroflexota bacterium]